MEVRHSYDRKRMRSPSPSQSEHRSCSTRSESPGASSHSSDAQDHPYYVQDEDVARGGAPAAGAEARNPPNEDSLLSAFITFTLLTSNIFKLTPYIVYQVLRGDSFPQKIVLLPSRNDDPSTSSFGQRAIGQVKVEKALVQFLNHTELVRLESKMNNVIIRLLEGDGRTVAAAYRINLRRSREPKVFAFKNSESSIIVTPQCVHLMGPIFERHWTASSELPHSSSLLAMFTAAHMQTQACASRISSVSPGSRTRKYVRPNIVSRDLTALSPGSLPRNWTVMRHPVYDAPFYMYTDPVTGERRSKWEHPGGSTVGE